MAQPRVHIAGPRTDSPEATALTPPLLPGPWGPLLLLGRQPCLWRLLTSPLLLSGALILQFLSIFIHKSLLTILFNALFRVTLFKISAPGDPYLTLQTLSLSRHSTSHLSHRKSGSFSARQGFRVIHSGSARFSKVSEQSCSWKLSYALATV